MSITVPKFPTSSDDINLAVSLQYGTAQGIVQLQKFMREFVAKVYQPGYSDCTTLIDTGNTDGWSRVIQTLCNLGEVCLTEEWTYPSAITSPNPFNVSRSTVA